MSHSQYLTRAFDPDYLESEFKRLVVSDPAVEYDVLVGIGLSGALALSALRARIPDLPIAIIRKDRDSEHATYRIESTIDLDFSRNTRWIFVDDLISSGETLRKVKRTMAARYPSSKYAGTFLYNPSTYRVDDAGRLNLEGVQS